MHNFCLQKEDTRYILILVVSAIVLYGTLFSLRFEGLWASDAFDYAQMARHIYNGDGFITSYIRPLSLAFNDSLENHPNLIKPPLFPLVVAASFYILGVNDTAVTLVSGFFYVMLVPLVYLFAREMFDRRVALWAGVISLTSLIILYFAMQGLTDIMFTFLFTFTLYLLYKRANPLLIGVLVGLCYLARYNMLAFIPGILLFMYLTYPNRKWMILRVLAVFALIASPWWIRNYIEVGNPFFTLLSYAVPCCTSDAEVVGMIWGRFEVIEPLDFILAHPIIMIKKFISITAEYFVWIPRITPNFFIPALALAGFLDLRRGEKNFIFTVSVLVMALLQVLVLGFGEYDNRLFLAFLPIGIILASYKIVNVIGNSKEMNIRKLAVVGIFILIIPAVEVFGAFFLTDYSPFFRVSEEETNYFNSVIPENEPIVGDLTALAAWYFGRISINPPWTYELMQSNLPEINYVYMKGWDENTRKEYIDNPEFREDFELIKEFDSGALLFKKKN